MDNLPLAEDLGVDDKLTDDQHAAIDVEKNVDWSMTKKEVSIEEPKKEPVKEDVKEEVKEPELTPEELAAKEVTDKAEKVETDRLEAKAKELEKTVDEVKDAETQEKAETDRIAKVAEEEGMTVEEVIEQEVKDKTIAERHGNDPIKIARALRKEQSEYGKSKNELEELRSFKNQVEVERTQFNAQQLETQMEADRDKIIDIFMKNFPTESENLSEDAIFERGKARILKAKEEQSRVATEESAGKAKDRRIEIIKAIPDEYKEFIPDIKGLLEKCGDKQVLDPGFDASWISNLSRGKKYTPEYVKMMEDSAYKRGAEQSKIIPKVQTPKPSKQSNGSGEGGSLSNSEKYRAEEMYARRDGWSKERMWDEYAKNDKGKDF